MRNVRERDVVLLLSRSKNRVLQCYFTSLSHSWSARLGAWLSATRALPLLHFDINRFSATARSYALNSHNLKKSNNPIFLLLFIVIITNTHVYLEFIKLVLWILTPAPRACVECIFVQHKVNTNGKLWGSGAFFLPPQGMYYPVSILLNYLLRSGRKVRKFIGSYGR